MCFVVAAKKSTKWLNCEIILKMESIRDTFEANVLAAFPDAHINSAGAKRAWTTSLIFSPDVKGELLFLMLSERSICASSGSECQMIDCGDR